MAHNRNDRYGRYAGHRFDCMMEPCSAAMGLDAQCVTRLNAGIAGTRDRFARIAARGRLRETAGKLTTGDYRLEKTTNRAIGNVRRLTATDS